MPQIELKPISYAGVTLNDASRSVFFLKGHGLHDNTPPGIVSVERIGVFPSYVRTQPGPGKIYVLALFPTTDPAAVIDALRPTFDPAIQTSPVLIVEDENGVQKTCPMVPQGMHFQPGGWWEIPLWAPEPDFVSVVVNTHTVTNLADVTKSFTPAIVNDGDGNAFPHTIIIAPQAKKSAWSGWQKMWELTFAWRSEFPATSPGSGSWLLDVTDGGIDTSVLVDIVGITTTCTTTITEAQAMTRAAPFSLVVGSTAGWDTKGILLTTDTEEQFEYEVIDATHIDVSARALGGTTAVVHTATFTIHQSRMLKDGRDIAVFINNVQVPPEKVNLVGMNTSSTKIWVEYSQGPGSQAIIEDVGDASASETDFILDRADHGWKVGDYLVRDSGSADEQVRISAIDGVNITVVRGVRNSPAGTVTKLDVFWKVDTHFQVAYNSSVALEERPTNPDPPLINLALSTNLQWEWTTAPIWVGSSRSAGAWTRGLYAGSAVAPTKLSAKVGLDDDGTSIRFTDIEPSAAKPNFDMVEFAAACGIGAASGDVEYDASLGWPFSLQVIGKDLQGLEAEIHSRVGHEAGGSHHFPVVYTDRTEIPGAVLSGLILRARNCIVTGFYQGLDANAEGLVIALTVGTDAQQFVIDDDTEILGIITRLKNTSSSEDLEVQINKEASGGGVGATIIGPFQHTEASSSFHHICYNEAIIARPILVAGTYFLAMFENAATGGQSVKSLSPQYTRGSRWQWESGPANYEDKIVDDLYFAILSLIADVQPEVVSRTEEELTVTNIKIIFDTVRVPMIAKQADEDAYYMDTSIKRAAQNEMRIRFLDRWADMDTFNVSINNVTRLVTASRYGDEIRSILTVQTDDWLIIPSGAVTIDAVPNLEAEDEDLTLQFRDLWQA